MIKVSFRSGQLPARLAPQGSGDFFANGFALVTITSRLHQMLGVSF